MTTDEIWASALQEVDSAERQPGLWARCFAQANGDESKAKAAYISARVEQQVPTSTKTGFCPNCKHECLQSATKCEKCGALLGEGGWTLRTSLRSPPSLSKLPAFESTRSPVETPVKPFKWWLWIPLGLFAAFMLFGAMLPSDPAKDNARQAITLCRETVNDVLLSTSARLLARGACERMEGAFRAQYGVNP